MLVIFDCDGVLVDSEAIAARAFSKALVQVGVNLSPAECMSWFRGHTLAECFHLLSKAGHQLPADFGELLTSVEAPMFATQLQPVAGVAAVIELLQEKAIAFCVASNGHLGKVERSLNITGLMRYFEGNYFSAEQVEVGKPSPELFLFAAECMGVPAKFCTVVEDSMAGVTAAKRAGMRVLCYDPNKDAVIGEVQKFQSMNELPDLLLCNVG